jgi:integrase
MPKLSPVPFRQFHAEVLRLYQPPARRPATRAKIRQVLDEFKKICKTTSDLDPAKIADWMAAHPDRAAATHRSLLSAFRAACSYGEYKKYLENPFAFRRLVDWLPDDELDESEEFSRHRSAEEIALVLRLADVEAATGDWEAVRLRAAIYTWAYTGAGNKEVLGLRTADVDLPKNIITFRSHARRRLKTGARAAIASIAPPLAEVLAPYLPHTGCEWLFPHKYLTGPWLHGSVGSKPLDQVKQLGERAGVPGLTILSLRHTVGTLAEGWDIGELMLQRILRHSRRKTQRSYRHLDLRQLHDAAAKIRYQ